MTTTRRHFLRGAAGSFGTASLALPLLPSLARAQDADAYPLRLVILFNGNGTIRDSWLPQHQDGRVTQLSPILSPLQRHLEKLMVVDGLSLEAAKGEYQPKGGFHGHERGLGCLLTGRRLELGNFVEKSGYPAGPSLDNLLASRLGEESPLGALAVGILSRQHYGGDHNRSTMSYFGADQPKFMQSDGSKLFSTIFGEPTESEAAYQRTRARRSSVLDFLREDLARVEARISTEDKRRLEKHTAAFRSLEQQLEQGPPACEPITLAEPSDWLDASNVDAITAFQFEQTVQALTCDRTRVAAIQFGNGLGGVPLTPIGDDYSGQSWHESSHLTDSASVGDMVAINTFVAGKLAYLLDLMDAVPEGDGTLLDHSLVLWVNELANGELHTYDGSPLVMAGGASGAFKTGGAFEDVAGRTNNDLALAILHAFGFTDVQEFGMREVTSGPLEQLRA
ncbi:MAG: DUF1552 domain-containing protein [Myxococcota bacterium]